MGHHHTTLRESEPQRCLDAELNHIELMRQLREYAEKKDSRRRRRRRAPTPLPEAHPPVPQPAR